MVSIDPIWTGETVVILGSGPSLTHEDVESIRGRARVLAINTSYQMAPWADALYAADRHWWRTHKGAPDFPGLKYSVSAKIEFPDVHLLQRSDGGGLDVNRSTLRIGNLKGLSSANSGYQAINLAVHFGVSRIVLLGYDMQVSGRRAHWHPPHEHPRSSPYRDFQRAFPTMVKPLHARGIEIVNCSRETALRCFRRAALSDTLLAVAA